MKIVKDEYPDLVKYDVSQNFDKVEFPKEFIDLVKEWIPIHLTVGTVWGRNSPIEQREQTEELSAKCSSLKKQILNFELYGSITFNINSTPVIMEIYYDETLKEKSIKWIETQIVDFNFKWS